MAENSGNPPVPGDAAGAYHPDGRPYEPPTVITGIPPAEQREGQTYATLGRDYDIRPEITRQFTRSYPNGVRAAKGTTVTVGLSRDLQTWQRIQDNQDSRNTRQGNVVLGNGATIGPGPLARGREAQQGRQQSSAQGGGQRQSPNSRDLRHPEGPPKGRGVG